MKNKITGGIAVCALAFAPMAFAHSFKFEDKYVGVEAIQTNQDFKAGFGKKVFKKNTQDYSVFGGFNFHKNFGAEVGFEFQPNKKKTVALIPGDSFPGLAPLASNATAKSEIKSTSPYLGLFAEHKCNHGFGHIKYQGLIGLSVTHVKATHSTLSSGSVVPGSLRTYSKTKIVPMVKLAATYMATDHVGIRLSGNYRNMSAFKIKANENPANVVKLKDSFGVGLGLTYSFH